MHLNHNRDIVDLISFGEVIQRLAHFFGYLLRDRLSFVMEMDKDITRVRNEASYHRGCELLDLSMMNSVQGADNRIWRRLSCERTYPGTLRAGERILYALCKRPGQPTPGICLQALFTPIFSSGFVHLLPRCKDERSQVMESPDSLVTAAKLPQSSPLGIEPISDACRGLLHLGLFQVLVMNVVVVALYCSLYFAFRHHLKNILYG